MHALNTLLDDQPCFFGRDPVTGDRLNYGGNYCGHYPDQPLLRLAIPAKKGKGGLPGVLTTLMERLSQYYDRPRALLPSLDLANDSPRPMRSERREGCIRLAATLLKFTDLPSLRVGIPSPAGFVNLTVPLLARHAGLEQKRAERALRDLKAGGLVSVTQARQQLASGEWVGLAAVKAVSKTLFGAFGLNDRLERERKKASKRHKAQQAKWEAQGIPQQTRTGYYRFSLFLKSMGTKMAYSKEQQRRDRNAEGRMRRKNRHESDADFERARQKAQLELQKLKDLEKTHPALTVSERVAKARDQK